MKVIIILSTKEKVLVGTFSKHCATSPESFMRSLDSSRGRSGLIFLFAVFGVVQTNLLRRRSVQQDNLIDYLLNVIATNKNIYPTFLLN